MTEHCAYSAGELLGDCLHSMTIGLDPARIPPEYDPVRTVLDVTYMPVSGDSTRLWACARLRCDRLLFLSNWAMVHRDDAPLCVRVEPCPYDQIRHTANCYWKRLFDGEARYLRASVGPLGRDQGLCVTQLQGNHALLS